MGKPIGVWLIVRLPAGEFEPPTHFKFLDSDGSDLTTWQKMQSLHEVTLEVADDGQLYIKLHEGDDNEN